MSEKEKLKEYLRIKGITKHAFCTALGFSDRFLDSGNSLGVDKLRKIKQRYPDLSLDWIVMDEGSMIDYKNRLIGKMLEQNSPITNTTTSFVYDHMKQLDLLKDSLQSSSESESFEQYKGLVDSLINKIVELSDKNAELIEFIRKEYRIK